MNRKLVIGLLVFIVLLGLALRTSNLTWGTPTSPHYRNYYQDERFALGLLFRMDPARLNFDPGYFINPSLHYYSMLSLILVSDLFGLDLHLPVKDLGNLLKPDDVSGAAYHSAFVLCRVLGVALSLGSILLLFLIGRRLYDEKAGLFAAMLLSVNYPCIYQAHFLTADGPAVFWMVLSLYLLVRLFQNPGRTLWRVLAPIGVGLAIGAKYLNALMLVPYLYVMVVRERRKSPKRILGGVTAGLLLVAAAFLVTTPYALLSLTTFLHGNVQEFGGIFGARGLLFYNNFPPSLTEPFAVTSLAALNLLGLLLFAAGLVTAFWRRRAGDILLLCFVVPFYLMLMYKSSPMLRHILPVLPFVFLICAGALTPRYVLGRRIGQVGSVLLLVLAATWLGLSVSAAERMGRSDTRVQAENWVRANVTTESIAVPTYAPYRYTPAIDSFRLFPLHRPNQDWSAMTGSENVRVLEGLKPSYVLMVEPEYRVNGRSDDRKEYKLAFMADFASDPHYVLFKRFGEPFTLLGIGLRPYLPTEDWNYPSPEIRVYRRT